MSTFADVLRANLDALYERTKSLPDHDDTLLEIKQILQGTLECLIALAATA